MHIKQTRATAFALVALLTSLPMGCDDEETKLDPISAVTKGEEPEEAEPIPPPPPAPTQEEKTKATGENSSPPDQAVVPSPKAEATEAPATEAPTAGEEEAAVTAPQDQGADTGANSTPPANQDATVKIFLSDDNNPEFGYIVAAQLDAWMPGEMPACKARFESWGNKKRTAYNKRLEGIVRYLVYHISDSFKTSEEVEAMTQDDLREWLSGEPTRLELYAVGRWHLPHGGATVPIRFGGKPAVERTGTPETPATEAPALKVDTDDVPSHDPEPETPKAPDSGETSPAKEDAPASPAPTPGSENSPAPPSGDIPAPEPANPAPDSETPPAAPPPPTGSTPT